MSDVKFELISLPGDRYIINDRGRTVALISFEGAVDWLLKSPMDQGPLFTKIVKDQHLAYTQGLRLCLTPPSTGGALMKTFTHRLEDGGSKLVLTLDSTGYNGALAGKVTATLCTDAKSSRYEWHMHSQITNVSGKDMDLPYIEPQNIYPGDAGRGFLCERTKEYRWILVNDRDGAIWRFPHQHNMHYARKIMGLQYANGAWGGFFGEPTGSPVLIVDHCDEEPVWNICQMYYDLHSCCKLKGPFQAGRTINYVHRILYLSQAESQKLVDVSKPIPVTQEDHKINDHPRLGLGLNSFDRPADITDVDQASAFRVEPPVMEWDRQEGCKTKGSLRINNEQPAETVWPATPPTCVPGECFLRIRGKVKTKGVVGKGAYVRLRQYLWAWEPTPHEEYLPILCSVPISGTTDGWVEIEVPVLTTPKELPDSCLWIDFILDGQGTAWLTDLDVDLKSPGKPQPTLQQDKSGKAKAGQTTH